MTNANDEAEKKLPTVLIVTDEPEVYRSLREFLRLYEEMRGQSGVYYDTGVTGSLRDDWRVAMPLDVELCRNVSSVVSDFDPSMVILIESTYVPEFESGPFAGVLIPLVMEISHDAYPKPGHVEAPAQVISVLRRARMRGLWLGAVGSPAAFEFQEQHAVGGVLNDIAVGMGGLRVPSFSMFFREPSESSGPALVATILRNLDPSDFQSLSSGISVPSVSKTTPPVESPIDVHGAIGQFEMHCLRMLDHIVWQSPPARVGWQVILGDNASGKTSLLRALVLCLLDRSERDALRQGWDTWLRKGASKGNVRVDLADIDTDTQQSSLEFGLQRVRPSKDATDTSVVDIHSSERVRYAGFLAAYGPFRRFTGGDPDWIKDFKNHPRLQSVLTLFDERAALSDALEWLKDLWVRARTQQPMPPEAAFLAELLAFINKTDFLPEGVEILEPDADGVWCLDGNGQRVPATELSDGYRAVFSLVLDLLRRLAVANRGYDGLFATTPSHHVALGGIVLIDEVDAHLHPRWQQRIGLWFKARFPRMQFIVATHSPIVCQAADSVMLLPTPGEGAAPRMATQEELNRLRYGDLLDAFSTDFFGERVTRSQAGRDKLDRLAELNDESISRELTPEEQAERAKLRDELGTVGAVTPLEDAG
ncbi:MAG: AAA family ATPase [Deltaproteobacteria bacterium]|nr:AAA family ATPase [Myxococcales bacterium]MDP3217566.1 AAA family ATPase [Deltaproteobacteria bacterium]